MHKEICFTYQIDSI